MSYLVRAFCSAERPPTVRTVLDSLRSKGVGLSVGPEWDNPETLDTPEWEGFDLIYAQGKLGIMVECGRVDDEEDDLAVEEIAEFIDLIGPADGSADKQRVLNHLQATHFIVSCRLLGDIDEDGFQANGDFLNYFVEKCGGMIQADGEGFYDGPNVIVPLE